MFKKPFDRVEGELRQCKVCNIEWHTKKPVWICPKCHCQYQKTNVRGKIVLKENYPFNTKTNEALSRFNRIHRELNKAWKIGPEAVKAHYDKQLKEIIDLGIWDWIFDRRDNETKRAKSIKSRNLTRRDYPDTRGHYEE
jgi:hypothetical protein